MVFGLLTLAAGYFLYPLATTFAEIYGIHVLLAMTLLMFGIVIYWLRRNRAALINEVYEREQQEGVYTHMQQRRASAMSEAEPWDDIWRSWEASAST